MELPSPVYRQPPSRQIATGSCRKVPRVGMMGKESEGLHLLSPKERRVGAYEGVGVGEVVGCVRTARWRRVRRWWDRRFLRHRFRAAARCRPNQPSRLVWPVGSICSAAPWINHDPRCRRLGTACEDEQVLLDTFVTVSQRFPLLIGAFTAIPASNVRDWKITPTSPLSTPSSAGANIAICTQHGSSSSPNKLSLNILRRQDPEPSSSAIAVPSRRLNQE